MVYLVSNTNTLFDSPHYTKLSIKDSLDLLETFEEIQWDSETSGRDPHISKILCIQFGNKKRDIQIVVDITTVDIQLYKNILETKLLIGHNLKFDIQFAYSQGIIPRKVYDTMIIEQLLYLGYPPKGKPGGIGYSLDAVADRYLGVFIDKSIRGDIIWRGLDSDVILYAANDVKWLEDIKEKQLEQLQIKQCIKAAELENHFVPVIAYLEWCGIKLDEEKWKIKMQHNQENLKKSKEILDKLAISWGNKSLYTINTQGDLFAGFNTDPVCTVNWSSSVQVIKIAKYLGFDTNIQDKKTGEDKDSVVEKHLKSQKGINDEFLKVYFDYQEASKVCSTYGQSYLDAINPKTGRIHTAFRQLGASSGRMACGSKESNTDLAKLKGISPKRCKYVQLQNLPADEETRSAFVSAKGNLFCSCDYSALEARLGADIYNEITMIEEFVHGSGDMHSLVAKACFPQELQGIEIKDIKNLRPDLRKKAKPVGFSQQFN